MEPEKRRALSDFYREEFKRHLAHLQLSGIVSDTKCRWLAEDLDRICWRSDFPALAESLLKSFEALTRLSDLDPRQGH